MSRRGRLPQSPHHINLYDQDWDFLQSMLGPNAPPLPGGKRPPGVNEFIKELVHKKVNELRARYYGGLDSQQGPAPVPDPTGPASSTTATLESL